METPLYYLISPLTGYAMFIFNDILAIDAEKLIDFSKKENSVACFASLGVRRGCMVCRILDYSTYDSYEKVQKEFIDVIKRKTGLIAKLPNKDFISITYKVADALYQNDSPEAFLPF